MDRRHFLAAVTALGVSSTVFGKELCSSIDDNDAFSLEDVKNAAKLAELNFTVGELKLLFNGLKGLLKNYQTVRELEIGNHVSPALHLQPLADDLGNKDDFEYESPDQEKVEAVSGDDAIAFASLRSLAALIRQGKISSVELTELYLKRLKKYDPALKCVISLTEERALAQAKAVDQDIRNKNFKGNLQGVPWGAKDLLAAKNYRTTWGAKPYENQTIDEDATVVSRLDQAGAVLVAKLTLGALAMGDVWYGGKTRNPWNPEKGSSGSSAGPASATAAGLTGFSIGSETWGSIVSPCTVCGATGLRPTFGRVSKAGAMALSWSMDKLGPICRSVEDCAFVFEAIHGADPKDLSSVQYPFSWRRKLTRDKLRIGYLVDGFEKEENSKENEWLSFDKKTLKTMEALGYKLVPISLPEFPVNDISFILSAEAAAAFDELTLSNKDDLMVRQNKNAWPTIFRQARFIPAVEYIQANRARQLLMVAMQKMMTEVDLYIAPSFRTNNLLATNLTGHPAVVVPNGFRKDGTPTSITFNGRMYDEELLLAVAHDYQLATDFHLKHPALKS